MPFFDDAEISKRHKERIRALEGEAKQNLTMAQRLTVRALKRTFTVEVPPTEEGGETLSIKFYVPAGDEWDRMHTLLMESAKCGSMEKDAAEVRIKEILDEINTMLADFSVDESLTKEFWANPGSAGTDESLPLVIVKEMFTVLGKMRDEGGSFRRNVNG
jgi:hypothetical protein